MPASSGSPLVEKKTTEFDDWPLQLGLHIIGAETQKVRAFIRSYCRCFVFSLKDLEGYREKPIHIQLEDDHLIFRKPYRLNVSGGIDIHTRCRKLLAAKLFELSNGEYVCVIIMPLQKDIFNNWMEK